MWMVTVGNSVPRARNSEGQRGILELWRHAEKASSSQVRSGFALIVPDAKVRNASRSCRVNTTACACLQMSTVIPRAYLSGRSCLRA